MKVLVIGGTLFIGRPLVQALLKAGHDVTILHRKRGHGFGRRVHEITADRNDGAALKQALAGSRFEIVFDNVYDWQHGTAASHIEATVQALPGTLVRYVFMSSVAAYGDGLNHHEGDALAPDNHAEAYVRNKAMSERLLFRMYQRSKFPAVTLRPPFLYGPGNPFYREAFFWDRMRDRRTIIVPGDGRRLMQFAHVNDVVQAALKAAFEPGLAGHAFNIANPRPVTQMDLVTALASASAKPLVTARISRHEILRAGGSVMGPKNLYFAAYYDLPPITMIVNKAQRMLRFRATPFAAGLKETYRWYLRHQDRDRSNYPFENMLLRLAATAAPPPLI